MILLKHELRRGKKGLAVWSLAIGFFIAVTVFLFPEMKSEMKGIGEMFQRMGAFASAFGLDKLNFGEFIGFYAVESGNILGLGGALFAALIAVSALSKEEKEKTSEYLFAHPVSRTRIITEKLVAVMLQIVLLNLFILAVASISTVLIGEEVPWKTMLLLHLAYFFTEVQIAGLCFGVSAFLRNGGIGIGLGIAISLYFIDIISKLTEKAEFLKYFTPFAYTEGAEIVRTERLDTELLLIGMAVSVTGIVLAYVKYGKKDLH